MKQFLQAVAIATPLFTAPLAASRAALPVIDVNAVPEWVKQLVYDAQQLEQMTQQVQQAIQTVHALTNIPQNMINQVEGLLQQAVQNPLNGISFNLHSLMSGSGVGTCTGGSSFLSENQGWTATGSDFSGAMINGSITRLSGLMACTQQMIQATQSRLSQLPQLLSELQACADVTCTTAVTARIGLEDATINTQQQQAILMGLSQQQMRWAQDDQIIQKQRADAEAIYGGAAGLRDNNSAPSIASADAPLFASTAP